MKMGWKNSHLKNKTSLWDVRDIYLLYLYKAVITIKIRRTQISQSSGGIFLEIIRNTDPSVKRSRILVKH